MRENRSYGSEGGEELILPDPIAHYAVLGMNRSATPLLHQRWRVGGGPSSNT